MSDTAEEIKKEIRLWEVAKGRRDLSGFKFRKVWAAFLAGVEDWSLLLLVARTIKRCEELQRRLSMRYGGMMMLEKSALAFSPPIGSIPSASQQDSCEKLFNSMLSSVETPQEFRCLLHIIREEAVKRFNRIERELPKELSHLVLAAAAHWSRTYRRI